MTSSFKDALFACKGLGFEKECGRVGYWSDVDVFAEEDGWVFFAHRPGMEFHYPKMGIVRPCTLPLLGVVDLRTRVAGYVMKKWRVYDLLPEAREDDARHPWRARYDNVRNFPTSFYLNVCDPAYARFDEADGVVYLRDWYVDVVKVVVSRAVALTASEEAVRGDLRARGLLLREGDVVLGGHGIPEVSHAVEEYDAEIVDQDELEDALAAGRLGATEASEARAIAVRLLDAVKRGAFPFDASTLDGMMRRAFGG